MAQREQEARPVALSVAGSDSSGGAGIQADLRTFSRIGAYGTTAVTAITAQNLEGVRTSMRMGPALVRGQIDAVFDQWKVAAAKTGMLFDRETVEAVADAFEGHSVPFVVDPVMVATSGAVLLEPDALAIYRQRLAPLATLITPNLPEAAVMLGDEGLVRQLPEDAARRLRDEWRVSILLKGGHREGDPLDVLCTTSGEERRFTHPRVSDVNTHGTGCVLSAAIAAYLALGVELSEACERGVRFVESALIRSSRVGGIRLLNVEVAESVSHSR